jgi:hypothetical protein
MAAATARQMTEGWADAQWAVAARRWVCWSLRRVREERRARSGGERVVSLGVVVVVVGVVKERRSGEGWPERERRISWSMVGLGWLDIDIY